MQQHRDILAIIDGRDNVIYKLEQIREIIDQLVGDDDENLPYIQAARDQYQREGEVEIDDEAVVSDSDGGAYVAAWVWVDLND